MTMGKGIVPRAGVGILVLFLGIRSAWAESPDLWGLARDPNTERDEKTLRAAQSLLENSHLHFHDRRSQNSLWQQFAMDAVSLLESDHAEQSPHADLRFLLGQALHWAEEHDRAAPVLESAIAFAPEHPKALQALFELAISYAKINRRQDEIRAYDRYLERQTDPWRRHIAFSNRAESKMGLGNVTSAIAEYREAIAMEPGQAGVLARWGLAISLDRSGDLSGALQEAEHAVELDQSPSVLLSDGVFFVPEYDRNWYLALAEMARARVATRSAEKRDLWKQAMEYWDLYLLSATPTDRWIALARARRMFCELVLRQIKPDRGKAAEVDGKSGTKPGVSLPSFSWPPP